MNSIFDNLFVFEMANNHQGSVEHGLSIIREMARIKRKYDIHAAVKFQYRDLDTFIHPDYTDRTDVKHIPRFLGTRLKDEEFQQMLQAVRDAEMVTIVTPFDEASVTKCLEHGADVLKIASCSVTDWALVEAVADTRRPMIASTGGVTLRDIDKIATYLSHRDVQFALMHCVGMYPAPREALHMNFVGRLRKRYPYVPIGYSGHEDPGDLEVVKVAFSKGAVLFERHVGVPTDEIKLNAYSLSPEQADAWVGSAMEAKAICGEGGSKTITQDEVDSLVSLKRGVYAARDIKAGETITSEDVFFAMPCGSGQMTSGEFSEYRALYAASKDYKQNDAVSEVSQADEIRGIRTVVHDIKGLLYEAQVFLPPGLNLELSHHDGVEQFRRTGTAMISVVNREYCKKILVMLPGQNHPVHRHEAKEETFQLLHGDLVVTLDGRQIIMRPGETLLVERSAPHSFRSEGGAVFEEISSTHIRDDSFYEDERINRMDPMERKTIIDEW